MKIFLISILAFVCLSCASQKKIRKPYYWRAVKGEQTYYFFGTMHVGFVLKDFPNSIRNTIKSSEVVALELTQETKKETIEAMKAWLSDYYSKTKEHYPGLKNEFSAKAWKNLLYTLNSPEAIRYVRDMGINHPMTELHPSLVYQMVGDLFKEGYRSAFDSSVLESGGRWYQLNLQYIAESVLDDEVSKLASSHDIKVIGLDNAGQAVAAMVNGNKNPFVSSLEYIFNKEASLKKSFKEIQQIERAYRSGNDGKLALYAKGPDEESLLINRNKTWFDELIKLEEKRIFVAVGALHLIGGNSLINLFQNQGFEVKRVMFNRDFQEESP